MLKSFLKNLEDPKKPLLGPNYWALKVIGMILPENRIAWFLYILYHEIVSYFVITQYVELYFIRDDFDLVLTNLKVSMLSVVCAVKANTFVIWQARWKEVINYVTEADKYERQTNDPTRKKILDKYTRYCRRLTYGYWVLISATFITTIGTPLMYYLSSSSIREGLRNGTEPFPHIFSCWMPFDKNHSPGSLITIAYHVFLCCYGALSMAAYDTSVIVIMVFFGGKLDLLRERCKQMLDTDDGSTISDQEFNTRIRELHNTHILLLKYSRLFNSVLSPVMFFYIVICSFMLCASAYQLTMASNAGQKVLMAEYLIFGISQLFVYCWHSNDVLVKNENVSLGPYESKWWSSNTQQKKQVLLLVGQLQIGQVYTAGPFTNLTLSTFVTILKGAYSYYTLLRE